MGTTTNGTTDSTTHSTTETKSKTIVDDSSSWRYYGNNYYSSSSGACCLQGHLRSITLASRTHLSHGGYLFHCLQLGIVSLRRISDLSVGAHALLHEPARMRCRMIQRSSVLSIFFNA